MDFISFKDTTYCSNNCPLIANGALNNAFPITTYVPTEVGSRNDPSWNTVMFYGEAPGADEDRRSRPFVGSSGRLLRSILGQTRLNVNNVIGNIVKCRPATAEQKNRTPTQDEINYCRRYFDMEMAQIKPNLIVALGGTAYGAIVPDRSYEKITAIRGTFVEHNGIKIMPTIHPSYASRNPSQGAVLRIDIAKALLWAEKPEFFQACSQAIPAENIEPITTISRLKEVIQEILDNPQRPFAFDYECPSLLKVENRLLSIAFASSNKNSYVLVVDHPNGHWTESEKQEVKDLLRKLLTGPNKKIAHRSQFEILVSLDTLGVTPTNMDYDTLMMAHIYEEEFQSSRYRNFKPNLVTNWLGLEAQVVHWFEYNDPDWFATKDLRKDMLSVAIPDLLRYNGKDAILTYRLFNVLTKLLAAKGADFDKLLTKVNLPMTYSICWMQNFGMPVNKGLIDELMDPNSPKSLQAELDRLAEEFYNQPEVKKINEMKRASDPLKGRPTLFGKIPRLFNMASPQDLQALFYDHMKLDPVDPDKKDGDGNIKKSVDKAFLEKHEKVPVVGILKEWRQREKIIGAFLSNLKNASDLYTDGRVRPDPLQHTTSGRLKVRNPNTQQLPRKGKGEGGGIYAWVKRCIEAPEGHAILHVDFAVHEVRCMALQCQDKAMAQVFWNARKIRDDFIANPSHQMYKRFKHEGDTHRQNASLLFQIPIEKVTDEERQAAKSLSFLMIYAADPVPNLAGQLKVPRAKAAEYANQYLGSFSNAKNYFNDIEQFALNNAFVRSLNWRWRSLYGSFSPVNSERGHALNVAHNMPVQGLASDICCLASYKLWLHIFENKLDWGIFNMVHDAVYVLLPVDEIQAGLPVIGEIMEKPGIEEWGLDPNFIPLQVDYEIGRNMADLAEWDLTPTHLKLILDWLKSGAKGSEIPKSPYAKAAA